MSAMAKPCLVLGEFSPHGREVFGQEGSHQLVPREYDGLVSEEELFVAGDGRIAWSSGRHVVHGFSSPSRAVRAFFCSFSALPREPGSVSECSEGRCLAVLEPDRITVHSPGGTELLAHVPLHAEWAWPLADGVLILGRSPQGTYHTLSLVGHPLNLPLCVSYIEGPTDGADVGGCAGLSDVWKNVLPDARSGSTPSRVAPDAEAAVGGRGRCNMQVRWVSADLPLAMVHVGAASSAGASRDGRHAVFLVRRRARAVQSAVAPAAAPAGGGGQTQAGIAAAFEAPAICREASEVFLQKLWTFPDEGPACEPDSVFLLSPDTELARGALGADIAGAVGCGGGSTSPADTQSQSGLLLALFVRATQRLCIVRPWSWEVVAIVSNCCSIVPLLPSDDIRARTSCPSGLASFPSRWYGTSHSRVVLRETNSPALPCLDGIEQPWAQLLLEPLELVRSSAVLCFDRHRLPQYLLVLEADMLTLTLYYGHAQLCGVNLADTLSGDFLAGSTRLDSASPRPPFDKISDAVANRFTLHCDDGRAYRCVLPLQPHSSRLAAVLTTISVLLPVELAHTLASDAQVWCVRHGTGRSSSVDEDDGEWRRFCELLFCLVEQALVVAGDGVAGAPPFKRARTITAASNTSGGRSDGSESRSAHESHGDCSDWEWLLGSSMHARDRLNSRYASGLAASRDFLPHGPLRRLTSPEAARGGPLHAGSTASAVESPSKSSSAPLSSGERDADVWEGPTRTPPKLLLQHLDSVMMALHLLYEEWKMHSLHAQLLQPLALLLYGLALRLQCTNFAAFYAQDFPVARDAPTAMAAFGGYGAWLWQVFPRSCGGEREVAAANAQAAAAVRRLRETRVPHLLGAGRDLQPCARGSSQAGSSPSYPEVFPLSILHLSVLRVLRNPQYAGTGGSVDVGTPPCRLHLAFPASIAHIRGVDPAAATPHSPLPPFALHNEAQGDAERARAMRRWLQGAANTPLWEVVLMLLVQHRITRAVVDLWSPALAVPVRECLRAAAEHPGSEWHVEAYELIGREDLAMLARGSDGAPGGEDGVGAPRKARDLLETTAGLAGADDPVGPSSSPSSVDPLESSDWLYRMFDRDRRAKEVARLLSSSRPATIRAPRRPEQSDHDFELYKQSRLVLAANRQAAICVGRGAFCLGAVQPLPTELLNAPPLALTGRFPPQTAVVSLDPTHHSADLNVWAEFSNGVATALQVSEGAELKRGWILHHRVDPSASVGGQQGQQAATGSAHSHAGFLCGLGLRGYLKVLPVADCYKYLRPQHDATSVAIILGMAASSVGSMDTGLTRMCCVHIPSMLPASYPDMEVPSPVQCAAVLSLGLIFARSAHRMMTELLVAEMGRRPSDRALHDREGYALSAGFALGCICLGRGADAPGLADLQLETWLLRYVHGGPEMPVPGAAARGDQKQNPNHDPATCSSLICEPEGINTSVTSMAGCVALALVFLRTNNEAVASRIVVPQNVFQLDYIRPDFAMLRLVARCLIMWDGIEASEAWMEGQLPPFLFQLERDAAAARAAAAQPRAPAPLAPFVQEAATPPPWRQAAQWPLTPPLGTPPMEALHRGLRAGAFSPAPAASAAFYTPSPMPGGSLGHTGGVGAFGGAGGRASVGRSPLGGGAMPMAALSAAQARGLEFVGDASEIDWLLVGQTKASLIAGACAAIGLRFAGTADAAAKRLLIDRLRKCRDAKRSTEHPARMASLPTPGMDLDRSTLETCQSATAMALGMVMAGTGDLDSLRILRSLRKCADLETSYGVHMATHMAIGFVFLGGGRYTFSQDSLSIAALLMASFPRFPTSLTDNRCHLQAFRHLYVLAARHRCFEAIDVDTRQPADVRVCLETSRGSEVSTLPRLLLTTGELKGVTICSERYWPAEIRKAPVACEGPAPSWKGRCMRSLETTRRLYVKRRSGHPAQGLTVGDAWFPRFLAPRLEHLERLLLQGLPQLPHGRAFSSGAGALTLHKSNRGDAGEALRAKGGVALQWLRCAGELGVGLSSSSSSVSSIEWASALCCEAEEPLPANVYEFDFEDEDDGIDKDGLLSERFAPLVRSAAARRAGIGDAPHGLAKSPSARYAHWLHECVVESKLTAYPTYLLLYLQTQHVAEDCTDLPPPWPSPAAPAMSVLALDQLLAVERFYATAPKGGASEAGAIEMPPLLSRDFLASCCASVRGAFDEHGRLAALLGPALRAHCRGAGAAGAADASRGAGAASPSIHVAPAAADTDAEAVAAAAGAAVVALFSRLHGLPGVCARRMPELLGASELSGAGGTTAALRALPRLRRALPGASAQGLRALAVALAATPGGA